MTTREEDYNIDKLYKLHLIYKIKISINRVFIFLNDKITTGYKRSGEHRIDLKKYKLEHKTPKYSQMKRDIPWVIYLISCTL